ncbi:hypothetical protein ACIGO9_29715 [Nocardia asteroides]|uniref:hypothetical protein n=1 Tax=Nocardia asteroides TaxID=1824 RepID=UPI0037C8ABAB
MSDSFALAPAPGGKALPLPELPCPDCGHPRLLGAETAAVSCANTQCSAAGFAVSLWQLLDRAGIDHNPAGPVRPVSGGWPIPWITPVTATTGPVPRLRAHWRMLHRGRLATAQQRWLCQHCGTAADPAAAVLIVDDASGRCLTSAPLHPDCAEVSLQQCPHLGRALTSAATIARGQELREGELAAEIGLTQDWWLPGGLY